MKHSYRLWLLAGSALVLSAIAAACAAPSPAPTAAPVSPIAAPTNSVALPIVGSGPTAATATPANSNALPLVGSGNAAATATLTGTVNSAEQIALAPNAQIEVQLLAVTTTGASAAVIATQTIDVAGRSLPIPFELTYPSAQIDPARSYQLRARITVDNQVRYATTQPPDVLTNGRPVTGVEVLIELVPSAAGDASAAIVKGTLTYTGAVPIDPNSIIEVQLQDVSQPSGPGQVIAAQTINAGGQQVPIPFELKYDPARIDPQHYYLVFARVAANGQSVWISTQAVYAITFGNPTTVEVPLQAVKP